MPTLVSFAQQEFPPLLKWQALAFMKTQWPGVFERRPFMDEPYPVEHDPVHFAVIEGEALLSYATIMRFVVRHAGRDFDSWALGNVFTFPPYRSRGFARQVVDAATAHINSSAADIAILFCVPQNVPFYTASRWVSLDGAKTLVGPAGKERESELARMMLFVSDNGKSARARFAERPLRVSETW